MLVIIPLLSVSALRLSAYSGATYKPPVFISDAADSEKKTRFVLSCEFPILFTAAKSAISPVSAVLFVTASIVFMPYAYSVVSTFTPFFLKKPCCCPMKI